VSDHLFSPDGLAERCFAAFEKGKWVRGCAFEDADNFMQPFVDTLINSSNEVNPNVLY
jgi:hypothetical protein